MAKSRSNERRREDRLRRIGLMGSLIREGMDRNGIMEEMGISKSTYYSYLVELDLAPRARKKVGFGINKDGWPWPAR